MTPHPQLSHEPTVTADFRPAPNSLGFLTMNAKAITAVCLLLFPDIIEASGLDVSIANLSKDGKDSLKIGVLVRNPTNAVYSIHDYGDEFPCIITVSREDKYAVIMGKTVAKYVLTVSGISGDVSTTTFRPCDQKTYEVALTNLYVKYYGENDGHISHISAAKTMLLATNTHVNIELLGESLLIERGGNADDSVDPEPPRDLPRKGGQLGGSGPTLSLEFKDDAPPADSEPPTPKP